MATDERDLQADPDIVRTWVRGWTMTRRVAPPVFENGAYRVEVGLPDQKRRHVFPATSDLIRRHAEAIDEPFVFLKVCAPPERVQPYLPQHWRIATLGYMMLLSGAMHGSSSALPDGFAFSSEDLGSGGTLLNILDPDGEIAATGRIAFPGDFAIYDRIRTHENHRRKGLGRSIMKYLETLAAERKLTRAVLVATPDGRALYETLGWTLHSLYTTAAIPARSISVKP